MKETEIEFEIINILSERHPNGDRIYEMRAKQSPDFKVMIRFNSGEYVTKDELRWRCLEKYRVWAQYAEDKIEVGSIV